MARVSTQPCEPESSSGKRATPRNELESGSKSVRWQRVLTNVSFFGEIRPVDKSVVPSLLDTTACVLMSDSVDYSREPETYQESLLCAEAPEWRRARKRKRDTQLPERQMMRVVPTPSGARPIKSQYIYKRKYNNKDGTVKKHKASLVALEYGQVCGVDVLIHLFAPVVKSVTVQ